MTERIPKSVLFGAACLVPLVLVYLAFSRPGYFTSQINLGGLILGELLVAAVWMYRKVYFPVVIVAFLLAGSNLPVGTGWATVRWVFLSVGALIGVFIMLKDRGYRFALFHFVATFVVLTALISAAVSSYPSVALLKVLSLFLLFLYASTGARIAVAGRENRFFAGLLLGCEIFVGANALFYAASIEAMGNPNSLGEVMGVAGTPILLWGALLGGDPTVNRRRWALFVVCLYLTFHSHARAGIAAAFVSSAVLLLALRKYKLLTQGLVVLIALLAAVSIFRPQTASSIVSAVLYKDRDDAILASRISPWQTAIDNIREHQWFGTGLGTTAKGGDASEEQGKFASSGSVTAENGSSYLSLLSGVGVLGALPVMVLLLLLAGKVLRTVNWMRVTGNPSHAAIPLAMVMVAGVVHATFEDWMFAPGNYICVFFWSLAFIFADVAPSAPLPQAYDRYSGPAPSPVSRVASVP